MNQSKSQVSDLANVVALISRQFKLILICPILFCIFATLKIFTADKTYTSESKIMSSSSSRANQSGAAGIAAQFGISLNTIERETNWAYPEIIKSRTLAKMIIGRYFDTTEFGVKKTLLQILTYGNEKQDRPVSELEILAVDALLGMIDVSEDIKTGTFTVSVKSSEPKFSRDLNSSILNALDEFQAKYNRAKTKDTKTFIEKRISDTKKELELAEDKLKNFRDRNRRIENSPSLLLDQSRLAQEVSVLNGVFTTLKQQFETVKIEELKDSEYVIVLDYPEIPLKSDVIKTKVLLLVFALLGIFFGVTIAIIRDYLQRLDNKSKRLLKESLELISKAIQGLIPGLNK